MFYPSRYGVLHEEDRNYGDNCLVSDLQAGGMSEEKLNGRRSECRNRIIPKTQIKNMNNPTYDIPVGVRNLRKDSNKKRHRMAWGQRQDK